MNRVVTDQVSLFCDTKPYNKTVSISLAMQCNSQTGRLIRVYLANTYSTAVMTGEKITMIALKLALINCEFEAEADIIKLRLKRLHILSLHFENLHQPMRLDHPENSEVDNTITTTQPSNLVD
jgi:hypothetical protein